MTTSLVRAIAGALAILALMSAPIFPQYTRASAQTAPLYAPEQLDQMLSPIALYPDTLLSQILVASTYPIEVVEAAVVAAESWPQGSATPRRGPAAELGSEHSSVGCVSRRIDSTESRHTMDHGPRKCVLGAAGRRHARRARNAHESASEW